MWDLILHIGAFMLGGCLMMAIFVADMLSMTAQELSEMDRSTNVVGMVLISLCVGGFFSFMGGMFLW